MSLRRLNIKWCKLTDDTLEVIVRALEHHPSMREINFTTSALKTLSESLKKVCHQQKITLTVEEVMKAAQEFTSFVLKPKESGMDYICRVRIYFLSVHF